MIDEQQKAFRDRMIVLAKKIGPEYSVDWRLMVAAAILETGWGKSELARNALNLFGIKATGSHDVYLLNNERFRKFKSEHDAFRAYGWLISQSSHYAAARHQAEDAAVRTLIAHMAPIYCPTDDMYGRKLLELVHMIGNLKEELET
jgi:flagellum-specific peptidoglycan hydrolase FlgJ